MRRTMALLLTMVLFLFAVGCGTTDSSSSDGGATTKTATTTDAIAVGGETDTTIEHTATTTTTTERNTTTRATTGGCTMPPNPTATVTASDDEKTGTTVGGSSVHTVTTTTTTERKTTTQKRTEKTKTICPTRPPSPTTTTVRTTQPTSPPASRLPEVEYLVNDYSVQYKDIVNLKKGGYAVAGVKYTNDYILSLIRIYDNHSQFQHEYLFGTGNGYEKIACCIDGGFIAASYNPPCLTKISSDFRVEWVAEYYDPTCEGAVQDVEEIGVEYVVLFAATPHPTNLKIAFLDRRGQLTKTIDLMKSTDISDGDIIPDGEDGFYLILTCNKELSSKYDLIEAAYDSSKGSEVVIMHFNHDKELSWTKVIGGGGDDWIEESTIDNDGNIYLAVGTNWYGADSFWDMSVDRLSPYRRMLVKLDQKGNIVYRTPLSNEGMAVDQVFGIHIKDDKAYVVGMSNYFDGYQEKYPCEQISPSENVNHVFCVYNVCIDSKGKELNRKVFRCYIADIPCDSVMLPNGSVVIGGSVSTIENPFNLKFPLGVNHMASLFIYE